MINKDTLRRVDLTITTSSGTGSAPINIHGCAVLVAIVPTNGNATYGAELQDDNGNGINGQNNLTGNETYVLPYPTCPIYPGSTFFINNASPDTTFAVRIYYIYDL